MLLLSRSLLLPLVLVILAVITQADDDQVDAAEKLSDVSRQVTHIFCAGQTGGEARDEAPDRREEARRELPDEIQEGRHPAHALHGIGRKLKLKVARRANFFSRAPSRTGRSSTPASLEESLLLLPWDQDRSSKAGIKDF